MSKALKMIKKYCDDEMIEDDDENIDVDKEENQEYTNFFSNPQIQTSFNLFTKIKKLIFRKHNLTMIHFFKKWQTFTTLLPGINIENRNVIHKILSSEMNNVDDTINEHNTNDNNNNNIEEIHESFQNNQANNNQILGSSIIYNFFLKKMKNYFECSIHKLYLFINRKKLANNQLTLLYIFTKLAISNSKNKHFSSNVNNNNEDSNLNQEIINKLNEKVYELERLNKKYENILDEKSNIIINKTDEIEALNEKIEEMQKTIQKNKSLNVIQESLCSRCGNSLEESFVSESVSETKKVIQEQLIYIDKIEKELKESKEKIKTYESKLKDLDEIKKEFKSLSESILTEKSENSCQTEPITPPAKAPTSTRPSAPVPKKKNKPAQNTKKKPMNNNVNIININNTSNTSFSGSVNSTMNQEFKDSLTSLKFDNSVLSTELLNLNKECTRLKSENRIITDKNSKFEKEKNELLQKIKSKSETIDKLKKENEELMVLIQSSKYKNIIATESENKKLKSQNIQLDEELAKEKKIREENEKKLSDNQIQMEKMKKIIEGFNTFQSQKENLILENTKYETEVKRIRYDLEEAKAVIEKQSIIINAKEKEIQKLNDDVSYYAFNAKKAKQDAEKSIQDAITYQKIVRKMEKDLEQMQNQLIQKMKTNG